MTNNKHLLKMYDRLDFVRDMIATRAEMDCASEHELAVYKKIPYYRGRIKKHLSSDEFTSNQDYKLYQKCWELINYY